jgi:hypothetical protein
MRKIWLALIASAIAVSAMGQSEKVIYAAVQLVKDQNITLKSWGSGTISETDEIAYSGTHSVRISTRNLFQGGVLALSSPVDLSEAYKDKNNLLRAMIAFPTSSTVFGGGTGKTGTGITPPGGGSKQGSDSGPGQLVGLGTQGVSSANNPGSTKSGSNKAEQPLKSIRFVITTTDGKKSEAFVPINLITSSKLDFRGVSIPLQAISGFDKTNKIVKDIAISGDSVATFYVGDIRVFNDSTPISADVNYKNLNLALNDEVEFIGYGFGGSSVLVYSWDFDESDGIQVDAEGQSIKRKFRKPGDFNVTLTVSDKFGLKKPYEMKIKVRVNP